MAITSPQNTFMNTIFRILLVTTLVGCSFLSNASDVVTRDDCRVRFCESEIPTIHKYYLSVSNVTYNPDSKALQMTSRFFLDDLEDLLSERTGKKIILDSDKDIKEIKDQLSSYLQKKLTVKADGKNAAITYLGGEIENDQVVLYIEIPVSKEPRSIEMEYSALIEKFEEQKNMIHLKLHGKRGTLLINKDKKSDVLKFS